MSYVPDNTPQWLDQEQLESSATETQQDGGIQYVTQEEDPAPQEDPGYEMPEENPEDQTGFKFNWLFIVLAIGYLVQNIDGGIDFMFYGMLAICVIIHELGHAFAGLAFKCKVKSVQLFFLEAISYKHSNDPDDAAWQRIRWSLGVLPFGGVTIFDNNDDQYTNQYGISGRPMWQQFIISGAGIIMNVILFAVLYASIAFLPMEMETIRFCFVLARLSLVLAVLNILPVYPLDGGAMLLQLIQMATGERLSQQFLKVFGWIGFALVILLFFVYTDWQRVLFDWLFGII